MTSEKPKRATVYIVDDNAAVRDAIRWLVEQVGLGARTFASARDFLNSYSPDLYGCVVLDIRMPGTSGVELHEQLVRLSTTLPVIFVTGHGDVPITVRAMKAGAFDFLQKPFNDQALLDSIFAAIRKHDEIRAKKELEAENEQRLSALTSREREVLNLLRVGASSKQIAAELNISIRTVEGHRASIMSKMQARSLGHLLDILGKLAA
jgi:FixJ family two-component response regulator